MPHLRIRGLAIEQVQELSAILVDPLSQLFGCPDDHITIEAINSTFFFRGKIAGAYPMIEVLWFDRGLEIQDQMVAMLTKQVRSLCQQPDLDIAVIVSPLSKRHYYDNGEHF